MIKSTSSELIICSVCKHDKELVYDEQDRIFSESSCKCKKKVQLINGMKPLDWAFLKIEEELKKGVLNE